MSNLQDRREHKRSSDQRSAAALPAWRDYTLTLIFAAIGLAIAAYAAIRGIPLVGDNIWNG